MIKNDSDKLLHIVSNETKNSIDNMSIVTPTIFNSIFSQYAKEHDIDIDEEDQLSQNILEAECSTLTKLQENTSKNAQTLSHSTTKAITAIQDKDETTLNEVLEETEALRNEIEKLKEVIYKDELTNSYNRKWLHDTYLNSDYKSFKSNGTLAILDLNYFKIVNDTHGHIIGDKVLVFIANELKKSNCDVIRYGGDEFILIFSDVLQEVQVSKILYTIREGVISKKLKAHNSMFRVSFSIGIQPFKSDDLLATVIEDADKNMYEDKEKIKKRITGIEI